ncbi:hypothetical protein SAMN05660662_1024 [Blastococcus aurantiacus]|uniref:Uncharacterized protein n=1 Tax=Blastococcus aurantiacus TaxID=1550231 RepID=A0A1G7I626_9ACTN|nr:hypothetical protein [Blastococcus aurantiacus]SDF08170.1 hypothetical protein SAMN05660662_1024 [Blastococcus aurantiacus]
MHAAIDRPQRQSRATTAVLRVAGAALLVVVALIHGYLWRQGYRDIDVIGPAFLLQTALGALGAAAVLLAPRRLLPWAAAAGAAFALGSLAALLLSTTVGLFGFVESTLAQYWWESFWVEIAATVVLTALAALAWRGRTS